MSSDHTIIKLEFSNKKKWEITNYVEINTFTNNQWVKEATRKIIKHFDMNEN